MRVRTLQRVLLRATLVLACPALALAQDGAAATQDSRQPEMQIDGFAQADFGFDFGQNDPDWFDVNRPTRLPSFENEFGRDRRTYASVRQSRFGVGASAPTDAGELRTRFEFDMFGVGDDAGETTIRLRLAYGQLGAFGGGQLWSPFMDADVFPSSLDYWGPSGMLFFRNVLAFWQPIRGDTRLTVAVERPGASGDGGEFADRIELEDVRARFPAPDISAEYRWGRPWGYIEGAGILRFIHYDDLVDDRVDLSGDVVGWGVSVSSNVKPGARDVVRLQVVYGEGIQSYFNDAPVDVGVQTNVGDPRQPLVGKALPVLGLTAFVDHTWNAKWTSTGGYSLVDIGNSNGQSLDAFGRGQYALANLQHFPVPNVMVGGELQWARRENYADGFAVNDVRIQVSFKYSFSHRLTQAP